MESVGERGFFGFHLNRDCDFSFLLQLTFLTADHGNCEVGSWCKMVEKEQGEYF